MRSWLSFLQKWVDIIQVNVSFKQQHIYQLLITIIIKYNNHINQMIILSAIMSLEQTPEVLSYLTPSIDELQNLTTNSMIQTIVGEVSGAGFWLHRANILVFLLSCISNTCFERVLAGRIFLENYQR